MTPQTALKAAVEACGTEAELARRVGVTRQAVHQWKIVPPRRALKIEKISGVSRNDLRPDLYPHEETGATKPLRRGHLRLAMSSDCIAFDDPRSPEFQGPFETAS